MPKIRIYCESKHITSSLLIEDKDVIHKLKNVLRFKIKDSLCVLDGEGREFTYVIENISGKSLVLKKRSLVRVEPAPEINLALAFPLTKEDRIDFILQKGTELGVSKFVPFTCQRSLRFDLSPKKFVRWNKIIIEAVCQSYRLWLPELDQAKSFKQLLEHNASCKLVGAIRADKLRQDMLKGCPDILFAVGPIGDFTDLEYDLFKKSGFKLINFANSVLKVETAAVFGVGLINFMLSE